MKGTPQYLPGGTEENDVNSHDSESPDRDSNSGPVLTGTLLRLLCQQYGVLFLYDQTTWFVRYFTVLYQFQRLISAERHKVIMYGEQKRIGKGAVVANLRVLPRNSAGWTKETNGKSESVQRVDRSRTETRSSRMIRAAGLSLVSAFKHSI